MSSFTPEQKFELITQNLQEVLHGEQILEVLKTRDAVGYWGSATTGRPHLGYFVPLAKIADFVSAGVNMKVLLADVHAFLDNLKAPIELVNQRARYYRFILTAVMRSLHLPLEKVEFIVGSSYQYTPAYNLDKYKLCAITTEHDARKAGAEVVKQVTSPLLSGMLYPLLQALDEEYLKVDFQFGGVDQRKIFTYAAENLPKIGYARRAHLMNAMVPGLGGGKMSSSDPNSKIDFLDTPAVVKSKISKAICAPGEVEGNGVLAFVRNVVVPIGKLMAIQGRTDERVWASSAEFVFTVKGDPKHGGIEQNFATVDELDQAFKEEKVHPADLKAAVIVAVNALLAPIQAEFNASAEFQEVERLAYPPEVKEVKKKAKKEFTPKPDWVIQKEKEAAAKSAEKGEGVPLGVEETDKLKAATEEAARE